MIWTNTPACLSSRVMSSTSMLLLALLPLASSQLLEIFGLSTVNPSASSTTSRPFNAIPTINWRKSVSEKGEREGIYRNVSASEKNSAAYKRNSSGERENQQKVICSGLREPLPSVNFMEGIPVLPGVMGSLPGAGSCLPRGSPLVRDKSPSLFQNMLRNIPGAHDYLSSLLPATIVDIEALLGKYQWAIETPSAHNRFCATTELQRTAQAGNSSSFTLQEKFRINSEEGGEKVSKHPAYTIYGRTVFVLKVAFGYGIIHKGRTYVYMQDDPCPYQIVMVGPRRGGTGQYEYLVLSNWARYPLIGLVRDAQVFYNKYKEQLEAELEREGFINNYSGKSTIRYPDWSKCRPVTPVSYIQNVLSELFG